MSARLAVKRSLDPVALSRNRQIPHPWAESIACDSMRLHRARLIREMHSTLTAVFVVLMLAGVLIIAFMPAQIDVAMLALIKLGYVFAYLVIWLGFGNLLLSRLTAARLSRHYSRTRFMLDTGGMLHYVLALGDSTLSASLRPGLLRLVLHKLGSDLPSRVEFASVCLPLLPSIIRGETGALADKWRTFMLGLAAKGPSALVITLLGTSACSIWLSVAYLFRAPELGHLQYFSLAVLFLVTGLFYVVFSAVYLSAQIAYIANFTAITEHLLWQRDYREFDTAAPPADLIAPLRAL